MDVPRDDSDGKVRQKMAVGEGRSLQHWLRRPREVQFQRKVTMSEVKKHNKATDCWSVYRGKVYDTTKFFEYHPGGPKYMLMAAGRDGTSLFDKYHKWVNIDFIMDKCLVGHLVEEDSHHPDSLQEDLESELAERDEEEEEEDSADDVAKKNAAKNAQIGMSNADSEAGATSSTMEDMD